MDATLLPASWVSKPGTTTLLPVWPRISPTGFLPGEIYWGYVSDSKGPGLVLGVDWARNRAAVCVDKGGLKQGTGEGVARRDAVWGARCRLIGAQRNLGWEVSHGLFWHAPADGTCKESDHEE